MEDEYEKKRDDNFGAIWLLYLNMFSCVGLLPAIQNDLKDYLPGTTDLGIGFIVACGLIVAIISNLTFGYFQEKMSEKYSRKKIFMITNSIWIISYFLCAFSPHYLFTFICIITAYVGNGAFMPIGFSIIGDSYSPKERGNKFGFMQVGLLAGGGWGIILGVIFGQGELWRLVFVIAPILSLLALNRYRRVGIDHERGRAETAFEDFEGAINYDYKITRKNVGQLLRKKSITALIFSIFLSGIATTTLGIWAIEYLTIHKFGGSEGIATILFIGIMIAALPGNMIGGNLGDKFYKEGKLRGRVLISMIGLMIGVLLQIAFYSFPLDVSQPLSWIIFIILGIGQAFLCALNIGNIFAIYSEVCAPELRSTANSLHKMMVNMGGVIGNLILASMVQADPTLMPSAILLVQIIYLCGTILWIIPYFSYPKEAKECDEIMEDRRKELEAKSSSK